jgi:hypothetical protein
MEVGLEGKTKTRAGKRVVYLDSQIGHSSLKVTSTYTHFEHEKKRALAERLLSCTQNGSLYPNLN